MIAIVPTAGAVHVYAEDTIPAVPYMKSPVRVSLARDGEQVGWVTFGIHENDVNTRATEATFLLSGAYVQILGDAQFEVDDRSLLVDVMEEVR